MFDFVKPRTDQESVTSTSLDNSDLSSVVALSDNDSPPSTPVLLSQMPDKYNIPFKKRSSVTSVNLANDQINKMQRPLIELMDRLRELGVQHELDLPQIVLVGSQNTGKSSLLEGLCGVQLPRASGTCTRCPMELRMKRTNSEWRCTVSIQCIYDEYGMPLGQAQTIAFGSTIFKQGEVEERVRRAQRAILSPSTSPEEFVHNNYTIGATELSFSKNYISIQIEGPDAPNLSLVDLPGLIASARQGKSTDIALIKDLVISYIAKPSTLILLTVACEADFETQGAHQLVKDYDPEGARTIGVLTKPDRIAEGDEDPWVKLIKNDEEQLDLGWFSVKQPDALQLKMGISWAQARASEKEWFHITKPWNLLPSKYADNLGTLNLVERLAETLTNLISHRLPEIRGEVEDLLQNAENEIQELPAPPSEDYIGEMMRRIHDFSDAVARHSEGVPANGGLVQSINTEQVEFRRSMLSLAPTLRPFKKSESMADIPPLPPCDFLDGEEEDRDVAGTGLTMYMDEVMDLLKHSRTRELPGYFPYDVVKHIIAQTTQKWDSIVFNYFDHVLDIVYAHYNNIMDEHFKYFESGGLLATVQNEVRGLIKRHREETRERLKWLLKIESQHPYTLNERYLTQYKSRFLTYYKTYRHNVVTQTPITYIQSFNSGRGASYVSEVLSSLNKMNMKDVKADDLAKLLPEDEFEPALQLMAVVSAYFQVSCKRVIDLISAVVDYDFVIGLSQNVQTALYTAIIKDDARGKCRNFLQESTKMARRRSSLQRKYQRLEAAKNALVSISWKDLDNQVM